MSDATVPIDPRADLTRAPRNRAGDVDLGDQPVAIMVEPHRTDRAVPVIIIQLQQPPQRIMRQIARLHHRPLTGIGQGQPVLGGVEIQSTPRRRQIAAGVIGKRNTARAGELAPFRQCAMKFTQKYDYCTRRAVTFHCKPSPNL